MIFLVGLHKCMKKTLFFMNHLCFFLKVFYNKEQCMFFCKQNNTGSKKEMSVLSQWYHDTKEEVLKSLDTDVENGLSEAEVNKRLESFGSNELEEQEKESIFMKVLGQLKDPMIIVLLIAAVLSYVSSGFQDWVEPVIILLIVVVNAIISISQENNADKSLEALQKMSAPLAKVI